MEESGPLGRPLIGVPLSSFLEPGFLVTEVPQRDLHARCRFVSCLSTSAGSTRADHLCRPLIPVVPYSPLCCLTPNEVVGNPGLPTNGLRRRILRACATITVLAVARSRRPARMRKLGLRRRDASGFPLSRSPRLSISLPALQVRAPPKARNPPASCFP